MAKSITHERSYSSERFFQMINLALFYLKELGVRDVSQMNLHKVLWYIDFVYHRDLGKSISCKNYQANKNGPTNKFLDLFKEFPPTREKKYSGGVLKLYEHDEKSFDFSKLSFNEKAVIAEVCKIVAPLLKNNKLWSFIHENENSYLEIYEKNPGGDIPYEKSADIKIDRDYRAKILAEC